MTGILCLHKPEGISSFQAVRRVRFAAGEKKAGHCGTLDPMATGVLPVMLGGATRFLDFLPTSPKEYTAVFQLGLRTDTLDRTGTILSEHPVTVTREEVLAVLPSFRGNILQVPPMYSALKKDGVRMYDLARQGLEVEREARPVTIETLELLPDGSEGALEAEHCYALKVRCSAGTYIRSLIDDIGTALHCGAVMTALRRDRVGVFTLEEAVTPEILEAAAATKTVDSLLLPVDRALEGFPPVTVTDPQANRFRNGGELSLTRLHALSDTPEQGALFRVYAGDGTFLGLGETDLSSESLLVKRVFVSR